MVYFLYDYGRDLIKIGWSVRMTRRLVWLRVTFGDGLHVMGVMPGNCHDERCLQYMLRDYRYVDSRRPRSVEWFHPHKHLTGFVDRFTVKWDGRDDIVNPAYSPESKAHTWGVVLREIKQSRRYDWPFW